MTEKIITANDLRDGRVVYLTRDKGWSNSPDIAWVADSEEAAEQLLERAGQAETANVIIDPVLIDVVLDGKSVRPARNRELIRALGPTVRTDLGYQAA